MKSVVINEDGLFINDEHGEIVMWNYEELKEDEQAIQAALNAVKIFYEEGPSAVRNRIGG